jgi:hypothetical protein
MSQNLTVDEHVSLCEALDRLLHQGVVIHGDVVLSVAGVDLVYLGLDVFLASVDTAIRVGRRTPQAARAWV